MATVGTNFAPESGDCSESGRLQLSWSEVQRLESALKDARFRELLVSYAEDLSQHEAEVKRQEAERGFLVDFLHPEPCYVIKTTNLVNDEKVFINVAKDKAVDKPESKTCQEQGGVQWSIPYSQLSACSQGRRDHDRSGRPCSVYDVVFHPDTIALAERSSRLRTLVHETALEAVEKLAPDNKVRLQHNQLKFPKMKAKGASHKPTVIRRPKRQQQPAAAAADQQPDEQVAKTPEYVLKMRHEQRDLSEDSTTSTRPTQIVVEILLPEMDTATGLELDVQERRLTLESTEEAAAKYQLEVQFPYAVEDEQGTARFEKSTKRLVVTAPVKKSAVGTDSTEVQRLISTDSGIEIEFSDDQLPTLQEASSSSNNSTSSAVALSSDVELAASRTAADKYKDLLFPENSVNIYEDLMIFTLAVRRVDEQSLKRVPVAELADADPWGFGLTFSTVGKGGVPFHYGFFCSLIVAGKAAAEGSADLDGHVDIEVWDNNILVKVNLPSDLRCQGYQVGHSPMDLQTHSLPQLKAFRERKEQQLVSWTNKQDPLRERKAPPSSLDDDFDEAFVSLEDTKERHSSGESNDSAIVDFSPGCVMESPAPLTATSASSESSSASPSRFVVTPSHMEVERSLSYSGPEQPGMKSILKRRSVQRCLSESNADCLSLQLSWTGSEDSSSVVSGDADFLATSTSSKKSVRFNETVKRQIFRPNASILGQKAKNLKKSEQKKRRAERRASEGDSASEATTIHEEEEKEVHVDSGVEEEHQPQLTSKNSEEKSKTKSKSLKKHPSSARKHNNLKPVAAALSEATTDLIFDIDF